MANTQVAGFHPISHGGGGIELVRKQVLSNNTTAIFKGDALDSAAGTGDVYVTATTNAAVYSVQWGGASYMSGSDRLERKHLPATTTYTGTAVESADASFVYCVEDTTNTKFKASVDEAVTLTSTVLNYVMVLGAGSTTSGWSAHELDATGAATTATFPWRLMDYVDDPLVDKTAADAHFVVMINAQRRHPVPEIGGSLGT